MEDNSGIIDASQIQTLIALEAIETRIHGLCIDLDTGDEAAAQGAFTPDAVCAHGPFRGPALDYVAASIGRRLPQLSPYGWHLTSHRARTSGTAAWAETYAIASAAAGHDQLMCGLRLLDTFEHRDGEWLIAHREAVLDWTFCWPRANAAAPSQLNGEGN